MRCRSGTLYITPVQVLVLGIERITSAAKEVWGDRVELITAGVAGSPHRAEYESARFASTEYVGPLTVLSYNGAHYDSYRSAADHSYSMAFESSSWSSRPTWKVDLSVDQVSSNGCQTIVARLRGAAPKRPPRAWSWGILRNPKEGLTLSISVNLYWPVHRP